MRTIEFPLKYMGEDLWPCSWTPDEIRAGLFLLAWVLIVVACVVELGER